MTETLATEWSVGESDPLFSIERELSEEQWKIYINSAIKT